MLLLQQNAPTTTGRLSGGSSFEEIGLCDGRSHARRRRISSRTKSTVWIMTVCWLRQDTVSNTGDATMPGLQVGVRWQAPLLQKKEQQATSKIPCR